MARKNEKGGSRHAGEKKPKDELQKKGSLQKSAEVNEDVFAANFMKPAKPSTTEEKSPALVDTASSKAVGVEEDTAQEKRQIQVKEHREEEKGAPVGTTGIGEPKRDIDGTKANETAEKSEAAEGKGVAPADKHEPAVVSEGGKTVEENVASPHAEGSRMKGEERADSGSPGRDKPGAEAASASRLNTAEKLKKGPSKGHDKKEAGVALKKGPSKGHDKKEAGVADEGQKNEESTKTLLLPSKADELSAAISAAVESAMPKEVKEAEKKFEETENAFMEAKHRAKELVQKSRKDSKGDVEAGKEADREAAVAVAEAVTAEATAQQALKGEVRAFLGMGEAEKKASEERLATGAEEPEKKDVSAEVKKEAALGEGAQKENTAAAESPKKKEGAAPAEAQVADKEERATAEEARVSGDAAVKEEAPRQEQGVGGEEKQTEKEQVGGSAAAPPIAQIKVSPAHLLDYSKRRSSDREAILAALAVVGLDTPETRRVVAAAEQEAAAVAEQEAAAAAAKVAAEEAAGGRERVMSRLNTFHKQTLAKLEGNQQYVILLEHRLQEELAALRDKYDRLMEPVFDERARILFSGGDEDDQQQAEKNENEEDTEHDRMKEGSATKQLSEKSSENAAELRAAAMRSEIGTRALPGFWLQAFSNHKLLSSLIGHRDKPLLLYLQNVRRVFHVEKADGFSLIFEFGENPFFTPQTLTKTFRMREEEDSGDWVVAKTEGTPIQWAEGMDVTVRVIMRKQLNMRTKNERMVKEYITEKSFFHFFKNSLVPSDEELDAMPEEEQASLFRVLKTEYDVGVVMRDLIIPHAVDWYLGTATDDYERSSDESEVEPDLPSRRERKASSAAAAQTPSQTNAEDTAGSFASWFGF